MGTDDGAKGAKSGKPLSRVKKASMENDEVVDGKQAEFWPTLLRAIKLARIYYYGDQKVRARVLLGIMLVLCALTTGLMVVFSYVQRDMMTALSEKNQPAFYDAINRYIVIIVIAAPLFAIYHYVQNLVELEWRLWLTRLLVKKYFSNHAYFALKAEGTMDNPDQRICEDARNYVQSCNGLLLAVAQKLLSMGAFFGVLWSISPTLLIFCFGYSLFGTIVTTRLFGSKLMGLHFQALRREADLRFGLVRAREHAESIALYGGAKREAAAARGFLTIVASVLLRKIAWSRNLALFTNAYEFATFALPSLIIAPRYFAGEVEFGVVTQAGMAFRTVQGALNIIIGRFEQLSGLAAETETVGEAVRAPRRPRRRGRDVSLGLFTEDVKGGRGHAGDERDPRREVTRRGYHRPLRGDTPLRGRARADQAGGAHAAVGTGAVEKPQPDARTRRRLTRGGTQRLRQIFAAPRRRRGLDHRRGVHRGARGG